MRFGREMDGDNPRLLLSLDGSCMALSLFQRRPAGIRLPDAIVQASAIHLHATTVIGDQMATVTAMASIGSMVFSSLNTPSPFLSENNSPI